MLGTQERRNNSVLRTLKTGFAPPIGRKVGRKENMTFYHTSVLIGWYHVRITNNNITVSKGENGIYRPILKETYPNNEKAFTRFQELLTLASDGKL